MHGLVHDLFNCVVDIVSVHLSHFPDDKEYAKRKIEAAKLTPEDLKTFLHNKDSKVPEPVAVVFEEYIKEKGGKNGK